MNILSKAVVAALLIVGAVSAQAAEAIAQVNFEWQFGAPQAAQNSWQAKAIIGQRLGYDRPSVPIYTYSLLSNRGSVSQFIGMPSTNGASSLNADGRFSPSAVMLMAGFMVAGVIIVDQLTNNNGEKPAAAE